MLASREAAQRLHSESAVRECYGIEGISEAKTEAILNCFANSGVNAYLGGSLEDTARRVCMEHHLGS